MLSIPNKVFVSLTLILLSCCTSSSLHQPTEKVLNTNPMERVAPTTLNDASLSSFYQRSIPKISKEEIQGSQEMNNLIEELKNELGPETKRLPLSHENRNVTYVFSLPWDALERAAQNTNLSMQKQEKVVLDTFQSFNIEVKNTKLIKAYVNFFNFAIKNNVQQGYLSYALRKAQDLKRIGEINAMESIIGVSPVINISSMESYSTEGFSGHLSESKITPVEQNCLMTSVQDWNVSELITPQNAVTTVYSNYYKITYVYNCPDNNSIKTLYFFTELQNMEGETETLFQGVAGKSDLPHYVVRDLCEENKYSNVKELQHYIIFSTSTTNETLYKSTPIKIKLAPDTTCR